MKSFERHHRILLILNEKRKVTIGYLAQELEVSEKTIMRDVWYLSDFIPVCSTPGRYGGGISYIEGYRYCDYKFYISEDQEKLLNKIATECQARGECKLTSSEIEILLNIIKKYSKNK